MWVYFLFLQEGKESVTNNLFYCILLSRIHCCFKFWIRKHVSSMLSLLFLYGNISVIIFRLSSYPSLLEEKSQILSNLREEIDLVFLSWRKTLCDMLCNYYIERTKHISLHLLFLYGRNLSVLLWSLSDRRKHTCHYCVPFYWRKLYDMLYNRSHIGKHSWLCVSSLLYTMLSSFLLHSFDSLGKCEIWYVWSLSDRKHIIAYAPFNFCFFIEGSRCISMIGIR